MRFKFEPYDNSASSGTIAELMLRSGQIQSDKLQQLAQIAANQQLQQGNTSANLITNLANTGGNAVATMMAAREAEARRKQAEPLQRAQVANLESEAQARNQQTQQQGDAYDLDTERLKSDHIAKNVAYGLSTRDPKMREAVLKTFPPDVQAAATKYLGERYALEDADRIKRANLAMTMNYSPDAVRSLVAWDPDPTALDTFNQMTENGKNQDKVVAYVNAVAQHKPAPPLLVPKDTNVVQPTPGVQGTTYPVVASGQDSPPPATPNPTEASLALAAQSPDPKISGPAKQALQTLREQRPPDAGARLTYAAPTTMYVDGKPMPVRPGSDGKYYGPDLQPIAGDRISASIEHKPSTPAERQVLSFYNRANDAVKTITDKTPTGLSLEDKIAKSGLLAQAQLQTAPNFLQSSDQQQYRQAQRAFTEARLRKESGAAINASEYESDSKIYFAQPGDSPATMKQKQEMRQQVLNGLKFSAGRAYDEYYGADDTEPAPRASGGRPDLTQPGTIQVGPYSVSKTPAKK